MEEPYLEPPTAAPLAKRDNAGKPQMGLIPLREMEDLARVLEFGAKKYGKNNWRRGQEWSTMVDSTLRHLSSLQEGEILDGESGLPHTAHILANAMMLGHYQKHFPELNDLSAIGEE